MPSDITVVGVCGSRRDGSYTRIAVKAALAASRAVGAETQLLDLGELDIQPFDPDVDPTPDAARFEGVLRETDAMILGTPMYHGSYSGVLKNAIDHCGFDEFEDKTVALLAVSGGSFPITSLEHLRSVCRALNAWVLPYEAALPRVSEAVVDERIVDDKLANRVEKLGRRVVAYATIEPHQDAFEGEQNVGAVGR